MSGQEPTADLIAAQIRAQGYRCETPVRTEKDSKRSKPTYRVSLVPDMVAHVERLD